MSSTLKTVVKIAPKIIVPTLAYAGSAVVGIKGIVLSKGAAALNAESAARVSALSSTEAQLTSIADAFELAKERSFEVAVRRFLDWMELHEHSVDHEDVPVGPGEHIRVWRQLAPAPGEQEKAVSPHLLVVATSAGAPLQRAVFWSVQQFGTSGTGARMEMLHGAALQSAVLAWLGNGSLENGGAGMAGGSLVMNSLKGVPVALAGGAGLLTRGLLADREARAYKSQVDQYEAKLAEGSARLQEFAVLLEARTASAVIALNELDRAHDDGNLDPALTRAFEAVRDVGMVLSTQILDPESGELTTDAAGILRTAEPGKN